MGQCCQPAVPSQVQQQHADSTDEKASRADNHDTNPSLVVATHATGPITEAAKQATKGVRQPDAPISMQTKKSQQHGTGFESVLVNNGDRRTQDIPQKIGGFDYKNMIVKLHMRWGDDYYVGTATAFKLSTSGDIVLLTCAHNIFDRRLKKSADELWVNINGTHLRIGTSMYHPHYEEQSWGNDLGILLAIVPPQKKAEMAAIFDSKYPPIKVLSIQEKSSIHVWIIGYPGEKQGKWGMEGQAEHDEYDGVHLLSYDIDTSGGQSGSPIIDVSDGSIIGVHTNGDFQNEKENYGTILTEYWRNMMEKTF